MSDDRAPIGFLEYFHNPGGDDDPVDDTDEKPDFFTRTFEAQILKAAGVDVEGLQAETAQRSRTVSRHYQNIAEHQARLASQSPRRAALSPALEKAAPGLTEGLRALAKAIALSDHGEGERFTKSEVSSQLWKTLNGMRSKLSAREIELAEKAVRSLDIPLFMQIIRGDAA